MTLSLHNPAELPLTDPVEERAARLLFSAGLGATTRAGRLLVALMRAAHEGRVTIDDRTNFAAGCGMPESSLRSALTKLESLALVRTHRAGPRKPLIVDLVTGPRPAALDPQKTLFPELAHVAEPPALRVAEDVATCPACDVTAETGAGHVRAAQEESTDDLAAMARRDRATRWRRAVAPALPPPPPTPSAKKSPQPQALTEAELRTRYPNLFVDNVEQTARDVQIPHSSIPTVEAQQDIPRNVGRRAEGRGMGADRAGKLIDLAERIARSVRLDRRYRWLPWSYALLAVEGPLSEADLIACIEGSHGRGKAFTGAILARLRSRAPPLLERHTLLAPDGSPRLHRFAYLRRTLCALGIPLDAHATQSPHHHTQPTQGRR